MIAFIIRWSIANRLLVLIATLMISAWGVVSVYKTPLDALPDLSDVQVIVRTSFPGQAPQIVENQVTYPLTTTMLSVPGAKDVRGFSFFGDSFVYIIFEDGVDLYWARSRVLEYLNQAQSSLPAGAKSALGPDATGVGWIYQYALQDTTGNLDVSQLRALQDWFLRYELKTVEDVAEVASVGGFVKQYQVVLDPQKLAGYGITLDEVVMARNNAKQEAGGSVIELGEAEYMVRGLGYLKSIEDIRKIPLPLTSEQQGTVLLEEVADIRIGPQVRRGITELNGDGEVVGGIVVMRHGENALQTIAAVKDKLEELKQGLPEGVKVVPTYDRSNLIQASTDNLTTKLIEEMFFVAVVCILFLWHARSAVVAIVSLPLSVLFAVWIMNMLGISANIMSLGGIAIAIGALVDAAIVMIENTHKHLQNYQERHKIVAKGSARLKVVNEACREVGPSLFFSLLVITVSFVPVFVLQGQQGRLFEPLAYTKTLAMAAAAIIAVTLIPVLIALLVRGKIPAEEKNWLSRGLIALYRPLLAFTLKFPKTSKTKKEK